MCGRLNRRFKSKCGPVDVSLKRDPRVAFLAISAQVIHSEWWAAGVCAGRRSSRSNVSARQKSTARSAERTDSCWSVSKTAARPTFCKKSRLRRSGGTLGCFAAHAAVAGPRCSASFATRHLTSNRYAILTAQRPHAADRTRATVRPVQGDVMFGGGPGLCGVPALTVSDGMVNYLRAQATSTNGPFTSCAGERPFLSNSRRPPLSTTTGPRERKPVPLHANAVWMGKLLFAKRTDPSTTPCQCRL